VSKKQAPEWIKASRAYRLLIEAAEAAYGGECDCRCCQILREWAETAPPMPGSVAPGGEQAVKRRA